MVNTRAGSRYGQADYASAGWTRAVAIFDERLLASGG